MNDGATIILAFVIGIGIVLCGAAVEAIQETRFGWTVGIVAATILLFAIHSLLEFDGPSKLLNSTSRVILFYGIGNMVVLFGLYKYARMYNGGE